MTSQPACDVDEDRALPRRMQMKSSIHFTPVEDPTS